ncbi:MAG: hypothetical protein GNW80_07810 [Asgard group archaeon]|nr:hypothetical protein [Asgard group archaeon]
MSEEEKFPEYEEEVPSTPDEKEPIFDQTYAEMQPDSTIEPEVIVDEEAKKRKRRRWILISIFGILTPILLIAGVLVFVGLALAGALESCAVQCCQNCATSCSESCAASCDESCNNCCSNACENSCNSCCENSCSSTSCCSSSVRRITMLEILQNAKNQLMWLIYLVFGIQ